MCLKTDISKISPLTRRRAIVASLQPKKIVLTTEPTREIFVKRYELMRVEAGGTISGICLSENINGTEIHWWGGRSTPCQGEGCEACNANNPWRWKGYLFVLAERTSTVAIVEVTAQVLSCRDEYRSRYGSLRGAQLIISRRNKKDNGPLKMAARPSGRDPKTLPECPQLNVQLSRIWDTHRRRNNNPEEQLQTEQLNLTMWTEDQNGSEPD
jgi:hypothetical protein